MNTQQQAKETNDNMFATWKRLMESDACHAELQSYINRLEKRIESREMEIEMLQSRIDELKELLK